jgi:hypothetical protein
MACFAAGFAFATLFGGRCREAISAPCDASLSTRPEPDREPFSHMKAYLRTIPHLRRHIGSFARNLIARDATNYPRHRMICMKSIDAF